MDDRLREIEERLARASEAHARFKRGDTFGDADSKAMARFQIAAYEDIPHLLQQLREAREALGQIANHDRGTETFGEGEDAEWETCEECLDMQAIARAALEEQP